MSRYGRLSKGRSQCAIWRSAQFGGAAASVTWSKQHKLLQTARLWLARHNGSFDTVDCRFDVLAFTGNDVEWFKDAFNDRS